MTRRESLGKVCFRFQYSVIVIFSLRSCMCVLFSCSVLYEKRVWSRIPDPRRNAIDPCFRRRIEMIKSADVSKSMRMRYARQYARANSKCSALFRR